jgi:hypothetical protein
VIFFVAAREPMAQKLASLLKSSVYTVFDF